MGQVKHTAGDIRLGSTLISDGTHISVMLAIQSRIVGSFATVLPNDFHNGFAEDNARAEEHEANAARLALCWNSHDGLVKALRSILADVEQGAIPNRDDPWWAEARAALAAAAVHPEERR